MTPCPQCNVNQGTGVFKLHKNIRALDKVLIFMFWKIEANVASMVYGNREPTVLVLSKLKK